MTIRMSAILALSMGYTILIGCTTLSKQHCLTGNWQTIGFNDGINGRTSEQLSTYNKTCAKAGIAPNYQAWELGYQLGLKRYCTKDNAYRIGRQGRQLSTTCAVEITPELMQVNLDGRRYYGLNKQLKIEKKYLKIYRDEYQKLRNGYSLNSRDAKEARIYLLQLPKKIQAISDRITRIEKAIALLEQDYSY